MDDGFVRFPEGVFEKEYWIHPTRDVGWIRTKTNGGKWTHFGTATLQGAKGKAKRVVVRIEGRRYKRHRLTALANDGGVDAPYKFRGGAKHPVLHLERREEDKRPNDADVKFGTSKENNNDPNNKKMKPKASGHTVLLTSKTAEKPLRLGSVTAAAAFLGAHVGNLGKYLNRDKQTSKRSMPKCERDGSWEAVYDEFELTDAVRLVRAAAELYLSPSHPSRLFRKLKTGKFCSTEIERREHGYVQVKVVGGKDVGIHRLVVETLRPGAFAAKLEKNPRLTEGDLDVDHVDGDECNNAIENLEVLTKREHARKHALAVEWIDSCGNFIQRFECAADVIETVRGEKGERLHNAAVGKVCDGVQKRTGGRFFRWEDEDGVDAKRAEKKRKRAE
jgi:hypothetical protein